MARTGVTKPIQGSAKLKTVKVKDFETPAYLLMTEVPPAPDHFKDKATFWWNYYGQLMLECGTLSRLFVGSLSNLCQLAGFIEEYEIKISEQGLFIEVPRKFKGEEYVEEVENPLIFQVRKMYAEFDRLVTSLGMTPYASKVNGIDATGAKEAVVATVPPSSSLGAPPPTIKMSTKLDKSS